MANLLALKNARTTFQRVSDAKFFNGWVMELSPETFVVYTCSDRLLEPTEEFSFQVFGDGQDAFFRAKVTLVEGVEPGAMFSPRRSTGYSLELRCSISGKFSLQDSRGNARFFVRGFSAQIESEGELGEHCIMIDLGQDGFSLVTDHTLSKGDRLNLRIDAPGQVIECTAVVRNHVAYALHNDYQRVGLEIVEMSRVDQKKWKQIYSAILEDSRVTGFFSPEPVVGRKPTRAA